MDLAKHQAVCDEVSIDAEIKGETAVHEKATVLAEQVDITDDDAQEQASSMLENKFAAAATPAVSVPPISLLKPLHDALAATLGEKRHDWEERPATAASFKQQMDAELPVPLAPPEHLPCPNCGRRFTADRLLAHRRACAGQSLPGFRAVVAALDAADRDDEALRVEREQAERQVAEERKVAAEERARAEKAEARATALAAELETATGRLEREKAAAKSMEAAYDVMAEAAEDGKKKVEALREKLDAAEAALSAATSRLETEKAAAKSMEAAYDVMAEAVEDGKKREAELKRQLGQLDGDAEAGGAGEAKGAKAEEAAAEPKG